MKFRIKYADQVVGVFVIAALGVLAFLLIAMGAEQRWFAHDYRYQSRFFSGSGLTIGMPIHYKGFVIGRIKSVDLNSQNEADVRLIIYDTYHDRVRQNSVLELVQSPIGLGTQLIFNQGYAKDLIPENALIPSLDTDEGKALVLAGLVNIPPKDDTITKVLSSIGPITENINTTILELNKVLTASGPHLNSMVASADANLPAILAEVTKSTQSIAGITANLQQTTEALKDPTGLIPKLLKSNGSVSTFFEDNNQLFDHVNGSLASVEGTMRNLETTSAVLSNQLPRIAATIEEARAAIVQLQDVLEGVKNNPLLRGGIPERVNPQAAPTSLRSTEF